MYFMCTVYIYYVYTHMHVFQNNVLFVYIL